MTIKEVSQKYDLSVDTLRYYEKVGLIPEISRTAGGIRNYTEGDCGWIELIKCMRMAGVSIEVLKAYCELTMKGEETITARKELLVSERARLEEKEREIRSALERLNYKISKYEEAERTGSLNW